MTILPVPILGVQISALHMELAMAQLDTWLTARAQTYICVAPAHSIMECVRAPCLLPVFNDAGMVMPDGMAVVWLLRLKGYHQVQRVYGPDLLLAACEYGLSRGWRHYFYGGATGVAEKLVSRLQTRFPGLQVAGMYTPPFRPLTQDEDRAAIDHINVSGADLVWVGLSSPKQEIWMYDHLGKLHAPVMLGIGAAYDFLSGLKPQAPRWMQRSGLEWLFRLVSEPRRLWPRYRQYPRFVWLAMRELFTEMRRV